jgi:membrane protein DedA with SNARE-associated domain
MDFAAASQWVLEHGYWLMFLGMIVEGPIVTAAAAFAAALGHFDIFIIFGLAVLGDFIPDSIYFFIGYHGHSWIGRAAMKWFNVSEKRLTEIRHFVERHQLKALMAFKYIPFIAGTGLVVMGMTRIKFRDFMKKLAIISLPNNLFWTVAGYYFGYAFDTIARTVKNVQEVAIIFGLIALGLFIVFRLIVRRVSTEVEKEIESEG